MEQVPRADGQVGSIGITAMTQIGIILLAAFVLSSCGSAARDEQRRAAFLAELEAKEAQRKALVEAEQAAVKECEQRQLTGELKGRADALRCVQEKKRPFMVKRGKPHMDLVDLQFAYRLALARRMDEGTLTQEEADLMDAELTVLIKNEMERRNRLAHQERLENERVRLQAQHLQQQQTQQAQQNWQYFIGMLNENWQRQQDRNALMGLRSRTPITCQQFGNMVQCY